jgi:hypothetical protein
MEPLDLAGRGRGPGLGQPVGDAVVPADPVEQHFTRAGSTEAPGELFPVVGQQFCGNPVAFEGVRERGADRPAGRPEDDAAADDEPGMIIDPGHDLDFGAVDQEHAADDVHLPQLHRRRPFPAAVVRPFAFAGNGF